MLCYCYCVSIGGGFLAADRRAVRVGCCEASDVDRRRNTRSRVDCAGDCCLRHTRGQPIVTKPMKMTVWVRRISSAARYLYKSYSMWHIHVYASAINSDLNMSCFVVWLLVDVRCTGKRATGNSLFDSGKSLPCFVKKCRKFPFSKTQLLHLLQ